MREILFRGFHPCNGPDIIVVDGEKVVGRWVYGAVARFRGIDNALYTCIIPEVDGENIMDDTLVLTIDENQKRKILTDYAQVKNVFTLNEFVQDDTEIPDPYGGPLAAYGECCEVLKKLIERLTDKLNLLAKGEEPQWEKYM